MFHGFRCYENIERLLWKRKSIERKRFEFEIDGKQERANIESKNMNNI